MKNSVSIAEPVGQYFPSLIPEKVSFDPMRDIAPVDQVGFVDLHKAFLTGVVPGDLVVNEESYNGVEEPASLVGRPRDVFEAIRNGQAVQKSAAAAEAAAASSAETE